MQGVRPASAPARSNSLGSHERNKRGAEPFVGSSCLRNHVVHVVCRKRWRGSLAGVRLVVLCVAILVVHPRRSAACDGNAPTMAAEMAPGVAEIVRQALLAVLPEEYVDTKHWGKHRAVPQIRWQQKGSRLRVDVQDKPVPHGTWTQYKVRLVNPDEQLRLTLSPPRLSQDGSLLVDSRLNVRLALFGRLSQWWYGVQLYSFSANAEVDVTIAIRWNGRWQWHTMWGALVPMIQVRAEDVQVHLDQFRLLRVSQVGGRVAEELGRVARRWLEDALEEQEPRLVAQINRQLERYERKVKLSHNQLDRR